MKKGKEYELLVEKIYNDLDANATITQDEYILGEDSNTKRQIDVVIRSKVADTDVLIIVQAKDWKNKADVTVIDNFRSVIRDVRASKGILICNSGFTKKALEFAKKERIELYSAHSAINKKWHLELTIPVFRTDLRFDYKIYFGLQVSRSMSVNSMNINPLFSVDEGKTIFTIIDIIQGLYQNNKIVYNYKLNVCNCLEPNLKILFEGKWEKALQCEIQYLYKGKFQYKRYFSPSEYRGLKDHVSDKFKHTFINFEDFPEIFHKSDWVRDSFDENEIQPTKEPYIKVQTIRYLDLTIGSFEFITKF